jgi:hypothetical protein
MGLTAVGAAIAPSALAKGLTAEEEYIKPTIRDLKANVDHPISVVILGAGSRGNTYASYARRYPDCMKVVGVADINAYRKQKMAKEHNIEPSHQFNDWSEAFLSSVVLMTYTMPPASKRFRWGIMYYWRSPLLPQRKSVPLFAT